MFYRVYSKDAILYGPYIHDPAVIRSNIQLTENHKNIILLLTLYAWRKLNNTGGGDVSQQPLSSSLALY
jgi:hypothetical protein